MQVETYNLNNLCSTAYLELYLPFINFIFIKNISIHCLRPQNLPKFSGNSCNVWQLVLSIFSSSKKIDPITILILINLPANTNIIMLSIIKLPSKLKHYIYPFEFFYANHFFIQLNLSRPKLNFVFDLNCYSLS